MIIESSKNLNRSSLASFIGFGEFILAILLYFYPDWAKVFLFILPIALLAAEGAELLYKNFIRQKNQLKAIAGLILCATAVALLFFGRKTFMVGAAMLMLMEFFRQLSGAKSERAGNLEKLIWYCAALLSLVWMVLIIFKGLHLYWSVREYLAFYFLGNSILSMLRRR